MITLPQSTIPDSGNKPMQLADPLKNFDWSNLGVRYEDLCKKFKGSSPYLTSISPIPTSDRHLYQILVRRFAEELHTASGITYETYLAMLYWKLYSQGAAVANTCKFLVENARARESASIGLTQLSSHLRKVSTHEPREIIELLQDHSKYCFRGMESTTALPVRTTFLHFARPAEVPIFDKQVLLAVGIVEKYANQKFIYLQAYLPHARKLAAKYSQSFSNLDCEGPLRLVDMALWVVLGRRERGKRKCAS
jgi:hypothetical protein